jgi:hypothetical protein
VSEATSENSLSVPLAIVHPQKGVAFLRGRDFKRITVLAEELGKLSVAPIGNEKPQTSQNSEKV